MIPVLERQKDQKFKDILSYLGSLKLGCAARDPTLHASMHMCALKREDMLCSVLDAIVHRGEVVGSGSHRHTAPEDLQDPPS